MPRPPFGLSELGSRSTGQAPMALDASCAPSPRRYVPAPQERTLRLGRERGRLVVQRVCLGRRLALRFDHFDLCRPGF